MTTPNDDALRSDGCNHGIAGFCTRCEQESHIRRLVAENTAQRELLRQALQVAESQCEHELAAAIRKHLNCKA